MTGGEVQYNHSGIAEGSVELTAVPFDGYTFKHFVINGSIVTANPTIAGKSATIDAVFFITARDYLKGLTQMVIKDGALNPISLRRNFDLNSDISLLDERTRELATADLYVYLASSPSSFTGVVEKDFYWEHRGSGYSMNNADRKFLLRLANDIYEKYGESRRGASITLINL